MDWEAQDEGFIAKILAADGTKDIPVGTVVAVVVEDAEHVSASETIPQCIALVLDTYGSVAGNVCCSCTDKHESVLKGIGSVFVSSVCYTIRTTFMRLRPNIHARRNLAHQWPDSLFFHSYRWALSRISPQGRGVLLQFRQLLHPMSLQRSLQRKKRVRRKLLSHQGAAVTTRLTQSWAFPRCLPQCHKVPFLPCCHTLPCVMPSYHGLTSGLPNILLCALNYSTTGFR